MKNTPSESRVLLSKLKKFPLTALTAQVQFMFTNVAYRATVCKTGTVTAMETETSKLVLTAKIFFSAHLNLVLFNVFAC
jgi:hypothetical protein